MLLGGYVTFVVSLASRLYDIILKRSPVRIMNNEYR